MQKLKDFLSYFRAKRENKVLSKAIGSYFEQSEKQGSERSGGSYIGIRKFLFFLLYSFCLISSILFSLSFFQSIFICFLLIFLWKVFLGLSWFNFIFLFLASLEANILVLFVKPLWVIGFILIFLGLFWKKLFPSFPREKYWQELLFYYLFLFWIIISYSLYFFLNYPFWIGFLVYALGLVGFSYFYFFSIGTLRLEFIPSFLVLILVNLEFFLLLSYLSLSTLVLGVFSILVFRFVIYLFQYNWEKFF